MASRSSAASDCTKPGSNDWQDNGEARHVGVRLPCGIRLENVYVPAGGDIPDRTVNPKFGQKLDFIERMTRWSEKLREPTLIVGDFNVAPLECDVWSHKALINVVSHTPVEVEALDRLQAGARLGRHRPHASSPRPSAASPGGATARPTGPRTTAGADSTICGPRRSLAGQLAAHHVLEPCRSWERPSDHVPLICELAPLSDAAPSNERSQRSRPAARRRSRARAADRNTCRSRRRLRRLLDLLDPRAKAPLLISGARAAALSLANLRDAADPGRPVLIARADWLDARGRAGAGRSRARPGPRADRPARSRSRSSDESAGDGGAEPGASSPACFRRLWMLEPAARDRCAVEARRAARRPAPQVTLVARASLPLDDLPETQIVAFRAQRRRAGACRADRRRVRRQAAACPAAQRMPDRRRVRIAEMRLRAAAEARRCS